MNSLIKCFTLAWTENSAHSKTPVCSNLQGMAENNDCSYYPGAYLGETVFSHH